MSSMCYNAAAAAPNAPLLIAAWTVLDAANDLRDYSAVEACRRVLDATYRGSSPRPNDLDVMFDFFE